jgi:hypothetical protein
MQVSGFSNKFASSVYERSVSGAAAGKTQQNNSAEALGSVKKPGFNPVQKNEEAVIVQISSAAREYLSVSGS